MAPSVYLFKCISVSLCQKFLIHYIVNAFCCFISPDNGGFSEDQQTMVSKYGSANVILQSKEVKACPQGLGQASPAQWSESEHGIGPLPRKKKGLHQSWSQNLISQRICCWMTWRIWTQNEKWIGCRWPQLDGFNLQSRCIFKEKECQETRQQRRTHRASKKPWTLNSRERVSSPEKGRRRFTAHRGRISVVTSQKLSNCTFIHW